jgi:hypothetical protein
VFFFICSGLLYIEKRGFERKICIYYLISVVGALLLIVLWPYYSFFQNLSKIASGGMAQTADYQSTRHYLYSMPLLRLGPTLAGIPFLIFFLVGKRHLLLVGGFIICSLIYLIGYVYRISLTERFVFFIAFILQMAVSRILREGFYFPLFSSKIDIRRITSWVLLFLLALGTVIQLSFSYTQFISPAFERKANSILPTYVSPNMMQLGLKKYLAEGDVVLSDIYTSWSLPVYTGAKIIALYHTSPHISDNTERKKAVETFYDSSTSREARKEILKRYGVTHILLNFQTAGKALEPVLKEMRLQVVACNESFCLFSVSTNNSPSIT